MSSIELLWPIRKRLKPTPNKEYRELIYWLYNGNCGICGKVCKLHGAHIDHIHPYYWGGKTIVTNLALTHAKCNMEKGASKNYTMKYTPTYAMVGIAIARYIPLFKLVHLL